jgi:hypothetical protein
MIGVGVPAAGESRKIGFGRKTLEPDTLENST